MSPVSDDLKIKGRKEGRISSLLRQPGGELKY